MARTKTTEMSTITAAQLADGDLIPVIDVSDTTMSSTGTNKKLAKSQLAEAAGVTAHLADTSDAHDASAISFSATGNIVATDVQAAIAELDSEKAAVAEPIAAAHIADTSAAHAASAVSFSATGSISSTDVQAAIAEVDSDLTAHTGDTSDAHDASAISVLDTAGNYTATDVEGVLAELPSRFDPLDAPVRGKKYTVRGGFLKFTDTTLQAAVTSRFSSSGVPLIPPTQLVSSASVAVCYVDPVSGSGGNNSQTPATARATISTAMAYADYLAPSSGVAIIYVNSPDGTAAQWSRDGINLAATAGMTYWVLPYPGQARWTAAASRRITSGWSNTSGTIYSKSASLISSTCTLVAVTDMTDPRFPTDCNTLLLTRNTSTPTTPAAGEFGYSSGTLYVSLPDGSSPNSHIIEHEYTPYVLQKTGAGNVILVNMDAKFFGALGVNAGTGAGSLVCINCTSRYGAAPDGGVVGGSFNATGSSNTHLSVFYNCTGQRSGNDGVGAAPNASNVTTTAVVGGEYSYNYDEGCSFHQNSTAWLFDVWSHSNVNGGGCTPVQSAVVNISGGVFENNHTASLATTEGGICYLDTTSGAIDDGAVVRCENGPGLYIKSTASVTRGIYRSYGNASSDNLAA